MALRAPPATYAAAGDHVYFGASHPEVGEEPWRIPRAALAPTSPACTSDEGCRSGARCVGFVCVEPEAEPAPPALPSDEACGCRASGAPEGPPLRVLVLLAAAAFVIRRGRR